MTTTHDTIPVFPAEGPRIRLISPERPWFWLAAGWRDFLHAPRTSLAYGAAVAAISILLVALLLNLDLLALLLPLLAGFALVSPLLAVGLYAVSRALQSGEPVRRRAIVAACRQNQTQIGLMGVLLMMIHLAWVRLATLLFALFFATTPTGLPQLLDLLLRTPTGFAFLAVGTAIGAVLATLTFAISAVSLPMLLDMDVSVVSAVATSWTAVMANKKPMALWAAIIAGGTLFGFATCFLGLIVTTPLLGYASWHAYRDLVVPPDAVRSANPLLSLVESPK
jgi:uncharacterized membrane protein